jgi:hypothetical protein
MLIVASDVIESFKSGTFSKDLNICKEIARHFF